MRVLLIGGWGYLGSHLEASLRACGHETFVVDCGWFTAGSGPGHQEDYRNLSAACLADYEAVILTAAHSSVPMCESDPYGAYRNNVHNFVELLARLGTQKFLYASSSCVYVQTGATPAEEPQAALQPCDHLTLTKSIIDLYAQKSAVETYGLRLGSVSGFAPNLRTDLMINGMVQSAREQGQVVVSNAHCHRPMLGMADFGRAVQAILAGPDRRGLYNLASFNAPIGQIAERVAAHMDVPLQRNPDTFTYDFSIATGKFTQAYDFVFTETVESIVDGLLTQSPRYRARRERCPVAPYGP